MPPDPPPSPLAGKGRGGGNLTQLSSGTADEELTPRGFNRRVDGFRHALHGGLWLAPLVYLENARFGPGWYGKVVSTDAGRLLRWAVARGIPVRALQQKSLPDVDGGPRGQRRRIPAYHIDLWGARLALAYDPDLLARLRARPVSSARPL
jgi:hypothetical protein